MTETIKTFFMLDTTGYNLFTNNCETLANYCRTGVSKSCQISFVLNFVGKKVVESTGAVVIAAALKYAAEKYIVAEAVVDIVNGSHAIGADLIAAVEVIDLTIDLSKLQNQRLNGDVFYNSVHSNSC